MRRWQLALFGGAMLGLGYLAGSGGLSLNNRAMAQDKGSAANDKVKALHIALTEAVDALTTESRYGAITQGPNAFLALAGGGDARQDLDSGAGVDPETFAALYAGKAIPEIADQVQKDDQGRLTFNGNVIQMYSRTRLQQVFAERLRLSGAK
jgi:hypothetical protein